MDAWGQVDDAQIRAGLMNLIALGRDASPAMADIAALGENSTRMRFRSEIGPDGVRWKPSLRAQLAGGRTLTKDGHLAASISSGHGRDFAEWGVNRIYAEIQQFGGVIKAKGGALRFRLANGAFVTVRQVRIPPRPYLGVSDDDGAGILDILQAHTDARLAGLRGRFHAG